MKLEYYKIKNFRSVKNTEEIETKNITALIGENESGKTNILLPLWKLNPATNISESKLNLLNDYPRNSYHLIHNAKADNPLKNEKFVEAKFILDETDKKVINESLSINIDYIIFSKDYNEKLYIDLFNNSGENLLETLFQEITKGIEKIKSTTSEEISDKLDKILEGNITGSILEFLDNSDIKNEYLCKILHIYFNLISDLNNLNNSKIYNLIPKFIYYSDYGNLDSEIYLPDVIENNTKENAKSRTIRTLFDFVNLSAKEIYEMGNPITNNPNEQEKKAMQEKINERQTLLESAATTFSNSFNNWWGQGNYNFKFEVDGKYFRIKVSDSVRKENVELEHRSRGLQWFFSFYLVFLVESMKSHKNCILLLDEPGVTLHPNSQKDLYKFFENLSAKNQLIYTTHSPFMINPNQLDMVYAVYVDSDGYSCITSNLRQTGNKKQDSSIYPAFAALGLSVSDTLLQGCIPVIVEGISDQIYLALIKNALINKNILNTSKELVFVPSTGVKGIKAILSLLSCIESSQYPYVIVDGDEAGQALQKSLIQGIYSGNEDKIISLSKFLENAEIEDLLPKKLLIKTISSYLPKKENVDEDFEDVVDENKCICEEIKSYCETNDIHLTNGYKVEIAKKFKDKILRKNKNVFDEMSESQQNFIKELFNTIIK